MKKIIIFTVFSILIIFSTNQIVSGETAVQRPLQGADGRCDYGVGIRLARGDDA